MTTFKAVNYVVTEQGPEVYKNQTIDQLDFKVYIEDILEVI